MSSLVLSHRLPRLSPADRNTVGVHCTYIKMEKTAPEGDADSLVMAVVAWAMFVARRTFPGTRMKKRQMGLLVSLMVSAV